MKVCMVEGRQQLFYVLPSAPFDYTAIIVRYVCFLLSCCDIDVQSAYVTPCHAQEPMEFDADRVCPI